ncbi:beta-N-acetylhexosaminidase [Mucilaginibacter sp.]|uniref:beta-N-acetylhexosaminidase n=1 Tax=Mucilaginibacter sp. TaxID=1882438 RepID=UPI0026321C8D|nr:beta-N-acetylhexosaminidase [Mucilaginibacter sp.]MDB4920207.1 beta-N-acetylhexosaminidase [Mucilaginibacter sp.]
MKKIAFLTILLFCEFVLHAQQVTSLKLLPMPKQLILNTGSYRITGKFTVSVQANVADTVFYKAINRTYQALNRKTGLVFGQHYITAADRSDSASLVIAVKTMASPVIAADESYSLTVDEKKVKLEAPNTIGALRGLQTLLQLWDKDDKGYYFPCITIEDSPRFKWRGLMIDAARHFISFEEMKKNLDAMAAVKMNVLHWHLSDDEGFRVESKVFPKLQVNGSNGDYYTQAQLKELVGYAKDRGIIVVPEFDMPGHSQSWFAGYPELASQPGPYRPGSRGQWQKEHPRPNTPKTTSIADVIANLEAPTFDPTNEKVYAFLDKFIGEMAAIFPAGYMHIGADENNGLTWRQNPAIVAYMKQHNMQSTDDLQRYYVQRIYHLLKKHHRLLIGWEEIYNDKLPADAIVHKWIPSDNGMIKSAGKASDLATHNPVLISEGFYLDVFMPAYVYYNNPAFAETDNPNILGGEGAQWTEFADNNNIDGRIWPRAGAIAERLWSPALVNNVDDLYRRLFILSGQLDEQGLSNISNYERALRRLTNGESIEHLQILTDVLTPVKGYRKMVAVMFKPTQTAFQTSPLTNVSDIVFVDSETKRKFRHLVEIYLSTKDKNAEAQIKSTLILWQQNDVQLQLVFADNKRLLEVQDHSKNLAAAAAIGLDALGKIDKGNANDTDWVKQQSDTLDIFGKAHNETEIAVIPEIIALVTGHLAPEPASYSVF